MKLVVPKVEDFEVTGDGQAPEWNATEWQDLSVVGDGHATYPTRAKALYSQTGIYFLVDCDDARISCTMTEDFDNLFQEDVVEVFLWPDESQRLYFEYEISPLGPELPILVANSGDRYYGWLPWNYNGGRKVRKSTVVRGDRSDPEGWSVEFCIPFGLLAGLGNMPPAAGTCWRGNVYRIDYDEAPATQWAWCPDVGANFHAFEQFGTIEFA